MRTLLPTERVDEVNGRSAVTDIRMNGERYVDFWIDETPTVPAKEHDVQQVFAGQDTTASSHQPYAAPVTGVPTWGKGCSVDGSQTATM